MNDIDKLIAEALSEEDAIALDKIGPDPSMLQLATQTFTQRHRFITAMAVFFTLMMMGLCVWFLIQAFSTDNTQTLIKWTIGIFFTIQSIAMLKLWSFMEMNTTVVTREIKRVELQLARLSAKINDQA